MSFEETIQRINTIVDQLLVKLTTHPAYRFLIDLPPLCEGGKQAPILDCQEYNYDIARLREVLTYKYLLRAFKEKQLSVTEESLGTCLRNLRPVPFIDYFDWGDYHECAYAFYKKSGNEKKARRHLLACYFDRGRAILSANKTFDCKDLIMVLMKDHRRMQAILVYVLSFVRYDFEEVQMFMKRSQYLLLERAMVMAVKLFAENPAYDANVRSCIYYVQSLYYDWTGRAEQAQTAREAYLKLGGKKDYDLELIQFMMSQPDPMLSDERFLDYILYGESINIDEIYPCDEEGNIHLEQEAEDAIVVKDGRSNFMDTYYRPMPSAMEFKKCYDQAEKGNEKAIREVVRRYREGDGVAVCEAAASAWENRLKTTL